MDVRHDLQTRLTAWAADDVPDVARLPRFLKSDHEPARIGLLRRLATTQHLIVGARAGVLKRVQQRTGRPFRIDVRQRVIVKAIVARHGAGAAGLAAQITYLARSEAGAEGARPEFFDAAKDEVEAAAVARGWRDDRHYFRFIVSPEHGDRIADLKDYIRTLMRRAGEDLAEPDLAWLAVCHFDTGRPHAHVLVRGRRGDGRDLIIPRQYIAYGLRGRAQELAHERLGDLSRVEAERRIWRDTRADRFTGLDRRLLATARDGLIADVAGQGGAWSALTRGRLRHLEALGLAVREGTAYRLDAALEIKLRRLQREQETLRDLGQYRLMNGAAVRTLDDGVTVRGRITQIGALDDPTAPPWVIVQDHAGAAWFTRLAMDQPPPRLGEAAEITAGALGGRLRGLARGDEGWGL